MSVSGLIDRETLNMMKHLMGYGWNTPEGIKIAWAKYQGTGNVYYVLAPKAKRVKIGYATDVQARLRALQTSSPEGLVLLHHFAGVNRSFEKNQHYVFRTSRRTGEWFCYSGELREMLDQAVEDKLTEPAFRFWTGGISKWQS